MKRLFAWIVAAGVSSSAVASLGLRVDIYDAPADGATVEADPLLVVIDVLIDSYIGGPQTWTVGGVDLHTYNGATLRYAHDPNGHVIATNQGTAQRFTTSFSKPRGRDDAARFVNSRAAAAGSYCGGGPVQHYLPSFVDVAWFATPPEMVGSPPSAIGQAVFRVAIDLTATSHTDLDVILKEPDTNALPPDAMHPLLLARSFCINGAAGTVSAAFQDAVTTGHNWSLWATPEPASLALLIIGGLAVSRHR